ENLDVIGIAETNIDEKGGLKQINKKVNKEAQRTIIKEICKNRNNTYTCIMGDFNTVGSTSMDTNNTERKNQGVGKTLIEWLKNRDFIDSFHFINPNKKEYTWQKDNSASRIDYIWLEEEFQDIIMKAEIKDISILTGSDHKLVWAEIETSAILNYSKLRKKERKGPTRKVFLYYKATEENWESYSKHVNSILKTKKSVKGKLSAKCSKMGIDKEWKTISSAILKVAMKHIPWITVKKTEAQGKVLRKKADIEERKRRENEISLKIEQRFNIIKKDKKKMLQSLLNKPYNKITLDRVLLEKKSHYQNQELINDEMEVKQQVTSYFQKQFRRRDQKFNEMNQEWQKEYEPKIDIDPSWYKTVMSPIEDEEWACTLYITQNKIALSISSIGYILFKKLSADSTKRVIEKSKNKNYGQESKEGDIFFRDMDFNQKSAKVRYIQDKKRSKQDNRLTQIQKNVA
ncbi:8999_t:CDS:2, partial [Gigaspora margarita]